jgi:hypothetical protein
VSLSVIPHFGLKSKVSFVKKLLAAFFKQRIAEELIKRSNRAPPSRFALNQKRFRATQDEAADKFDNPSFGVDNDWLI